MFRIIPMLLGLFFCLSLLGQPNQPIDNNTGQGPELMIFSGSDWCIPCMRIEKSIFSSREFLEYADKHLKVTKVDFPQKQILTPELVKYNDSLAAIYNPQGAFPYVILIYSDGQEIREMPTHIDDPTRFIELITLYLEPRKQEYRRPALLMGSAFEFTIVHDDPSIAQALLDLCVAEVVQLEEVLSEWIPESEVSRVNRSAGIAPVEVSPLLYDLTKRSIEISKLTQGAFDITFRGMDLWEFDRADHTDLPSDEEIKKQLLRVGYQNIRLSDSNKIYLTEKGAAIGFGALGKGLAADHVKRIMQEKGVEAGVINASGDMTMWGTRADGTPWNIGISNPDAPLVPQFGIPMKDKSIATSGSYEKYFTYNGKRYAHIINPKTGYPVTDKKSVTVISPSAELSDALATAFFVMDTEVALDLAEQLPDVHCLIIDNDNKVHHTNELKLQEP